MIGEGRFNNGETAASLSVQVEDAATALVIRDAADGLMLARWRWDDLLPADPSDSGDKDRLRLSCRGDEAARLTLSHPPQIAQVRLRAPALRGGRKRPRPGRRWLWSLPAAFLACWGLYHGLAWSASRLAPLVPMRWERALGEAVNDGLIARLGGACHTEAGQAALDALAGRLSDAAGLGYPVTAVVARSDKVNAFALPGARVVLLDGLLRKAESGDEVAGVLAHEMGHVARRHVSRQILQQMGIGAMALLITGDAVGGMSTATGSLLLLSYSRQNEAEADAMGVDILRRADISVRGFNDFFQRLAAGEKSSPGLLSSHPASDARGHYPVQGGGVAALSPAQWQALRIICGGEAK